MDIQYWNSPFPHAIIDNFLPQELYNRIKTMEYKRRQSAIGFRVSKKAFGLGRRVPIVNQFEG